MKDFEKDMSQGKASEELRTLEDKLCLNALEKAKAEETWKFWQEAFHSDI